jgi:hypothetical protein
VGFRVWGWELEVEDLGLRDQGGESRAKDL